MKILGALLLASIILAGCGGSSSDSATTTTGSIDAPAGKGIEACPRWLAAGTVLTKAKIDTCLDLGAVTQSCEDGTLTAVVVDDGQSWGLQPGKAGRKVADGFDPRNLCP